MEIKRTIWSILAHPNSLTLFRVAAVPLLIVLMLFTNRLELSFVGIYFQGSGHHGLF